MSAPRRFRALGMEFTEHPTPPNPSIVSLFGHPVVVLVAPSGELVVMKATAVEEIAPPSIEDPAPPLPWKSTKDDDGDSVEIDKPNLTDAKSYAAMVDSGPRGAFLTADDCRIAARILWWRAAEWEAERR